MQNVWPLSVAIFGNSVFQWILFVTCWLVLYVVARRLKRFAEKQVVSLAERRAAKLVPFLTRVISGTSLFLAAVLLMWVSSVSALQLSPRALQGLHSIALAALFFQLGLWASVVVDYFVVRLTQADDPARRTALGAITVLAKVGLWILVLLLILDNFSVNVSALLTGLGIGGVAMALAVQRILGDLLGSFSILLDRPFEVGDFIIVGDKMGTVEHIGIKSTRLRSLQGEQIIIGNNDLIQSKIQNFKRMRERRVVFQIRLSHQTATDLVERAPKLIKEIVTSMPSTRFDRAHFNEIGLQWLNVEVVYFMLSADFDQYMDVQESINLKILRSFSEEGIQLAKANVPAS